MRVLSEDMQPAATNTSQDDHRWVKIAECAAAAASACHIAISRQNKDCWLSMWAYASLLDDLIDEQTPEHTKAAYDLYERLVSGDIPAMHEVPPWADPSLVQAAELVEELWISLDGRPRAAAMQIAYCSRLKLLATRSREYATTCRLEALYCADIVVAILPQFEQGSRGGRKFKRWLNSFMALLCYRDSFADLEDDYKAGRISMAPSWQAKFWLVLGMLSAGIMLCVRWRITHQALGAMRKMHKN